MINYDKQSLEKMLKEQKAKYKTLADEIKAKKLQSDPSTFFEEIKQQNLHDDGRKNCRRNYV